MTQYVRIFPGYENEKMNVNNYKQYSEFIMSEESPGEGWYLVQKGTKPQLSKDQILGWTYRIENDVAYKDYFPMNLYSRSISKRKLMNVLKSKNLWEPIKSFMESAGVWDDFLMATTLDEDDQLLKNAIDLLDSQGIVTKEELNRIISMSIAD